MARVKKVSVVAEEQFTLTADVNDETGEVTNYIDRYEVIPNGRLFTFRHWNGGAMPDLLLGSFTSYQKAMEALAEYYKSRGISYEKRSVDHSYQEHKQRSSN